MEGISIYVAPTSETSDQWIAHLSSGPAGDGLEHASSVDVRGGVTCLGIVRTKDLPFTAFVMVHSRDSNPIVLLLVRNFKGQTLLIYRTTGNLKRIGPHGQFVVNATQLTNYPSSNGEHKAPQGTTQLMQ
ncbi:hypothetical protein T265_01177 [Opisthorchis viverrini]|uniref:Uncharacterized protein n=1 Tax=Opisthorchis viverrini TaxID=6198 RepID=A0A074ZZK2_OPIVI|nr:hypothetical protein T265_01177 [Opisthorchis viverrini]KER32893.1 hypothetical protein T265_01177 [Opisthorchis viverrini]